MDVDLLRQRLEFAAHSLETAAVRGHKRLDKIADARLTIQTILEGLTAQPEGEALPPMNRMMNRMPVPMNETPSAPRQDERVATSPPVLEPPCPVGPAAAPRRRRALWTGGVFDAVWMALLLPCAAGCFDRLLWAVQP